METENQFQKGSRVEHKRTGWTGWIIWLDDTHCRVLWLHDVNGMRLGRKETRLSLNSVDLLWPDRYQWDMDLIYFLETRFAFTEEAAFSLIAIKSAKIQDLHDLGYSPERAASELMN